MAHDGVLAHHADEAGTTISTAPASPGGAQLGSWGFSFKVQPANGDDSLVRYTHPALIT